MSFCNQAQRSARTGFGAACICLSLPRRIMKINALLLALVCSPVSAGAGDSFKPFELLDFRIGQSIAEAKTNYPAMECENSCVLEGEKVFGYPGRLWAGIENGKISQLAFRFRPALTSIEAEKIRAKYIIKYGQASDHLGDGCDECDVPPSLSSTIVWSPSP